MKKQGDLLLRLICVLLIALSWGATPSYANTKPYDNSSQHSVLVEQIAPITQAITDPAPAEQQPSFVATFALLATTEPSQSHLYANAPPSVGNQAETSPTALHPADAEASFIGQNGQLLAAETAEPLMAQPLQQQMAGPSTLTSGLGNISGGATTAENALTQAEQWLGPGYQEIAPGVFRSADGSLQFRMTTSDLTDPFQGPHVHFESIAPDGRTIIENSHVGITDP